MGPLEKEIVTVRDGKTAGSLGRADITTAVYHCGDNMVVLDMTWPPHPMIIGRKPWHVMIEWNRNSLIAIRVVLCCGLAYAHAYVTHDQVTDGLHLSFVHGRRLVRRNRPLLCTPMMESSRQIGYRSKQNVAVRISKWTRSAQRGQSSQRTPGQRNRWLAIRSRIHATRLGCTAESKRDCRQGAV